MLPTATDGVWTSHSRVPLAALSKLIILRKKEIDTHTHIKDLHTTFKQTHTHCNICLYPCCCCFSPQFSGVLIFGYVSTADWGAQLVFPCATHSASGDGCWSLMYAGTKKISNCYERKMVEWIFRLVPGDFWLCVCVCVFKEAKSF